MEIKLNSFPPYRHQYQFLSEMCQSEPWEGIKLGHMIAGRGGGKTQTAILHMWWSCVTVNRGKLHLWTSPTYRDCEDTFLEAWVKIIPPEYYHLNQSKMRIDTVGGSRIHIRSREVKNPKADPFRGPTYCAAVLDEIAKDKRSRPWELIIATLRDPSSDHKWAGFYTTPRMGWYHDLATNGEGTYIHFTSWDNPYSDSEQIELMRRQYSPEFFSQEVEAKWVQQSGRAWRHYTEEEWPNGNSHWHRFDPSLPYILACDYGVRSGYLLIQRIPAADMFGNQVFRGSVDVAVAEFTPNNEGTIQTITRIDARYGQPSLVISGADAGTRSETDLKTHITMIRQAGWNCRVQPINGKLRDKELQYAQASGAILNTAGERRFTVSKHLESHDPENRRGIRDVMLKDIWPEGAPKGGEYLPKDKATTGYEDMRDAFQYGMIALHPPRNYKSRGIAA